MFRKLFCAMIVIVIAVSFVCADEYTAVITKVDGDKVTVQRYKNSRKGEKAGAPIILTAAKDLKVAKARFDKDAKKLVAGDNLDGGLKNEIFKAIGVRGVAARITADDGMVSQILVGIAGESIKAPN